VPRNLAQSVDILKLVSGEVETLCVRVRSMSGVGHSVRVLTCWCCSQNTKHPELLFRTLLAEGGAQQLKLRPR
jgi:hypothetical protein